MMYEKLGDQEGEVKAAAGSIQAAEGKSALAERDSEVTKGQGEAGVESEDKAAADTEIGESQDGGRVSKRKTATEGSVGKGKVQEKGEAEAGEQQNQQTLKSGKQKWAQSQQKEKQVLKGETWERRSRGIKRRRISRP